MSGAGYLSVWRRGAGSLMGLYLSLLISCGYWDGASCPLCLPGSVFGVVYVHRPTFVILCDVQERGAAVGKGGGFGAENVP
jgi:hypothetical protein